MEVHLALRKFHFRSGFHSAVLRRDLTLAIRPRKTRLSITVNGSTSEFPSTGTIYIGPNSSNQTDSFDYTSLTGYSFSSTSDNLSYAHAAGESRFRSFRVGFPGMFLINRVDPVERRHIHCPRRHGLLANRYWQLQYKWLPDLRRHTGEHGERPRYARLEWRHQRCREHLLCIADPPES